MKLKLSVMSDYVCIVPRLKKANKFLFVASLGSKGAEDFEGWESKLQAIRKTIDNRIKEQKDDLTKKMN